MHDLVENVFMTPVSRQVSQSVVTETGVYMPKSAKSFIRLSEVQLRTGYSKAWIYRLIKESRFPKSVKIGSRAIAFIESEVNDWIEQRIAESRANSV